MQGIDILRYRAIGDLYMCDKDAALSFLSRAVGDGFITVEQELQALRLLDDPRLH